jgi:hypothetical protein
MDTITMEVLPDGTIKIITSPVSGANHRNADALLTDVATLAGGETTREKRTDIHSHSHSHTHDGTTHSH